jgi:choline kinase
MYYNRINELVIRKWIVNREYLTIWSLLLSNYKVKTIGEQILKCGISVQEIKGFFKIEGEIAKDFLEYLMSKDKYKFKLALYNCGLQHR